MTQVPGEQPDQESIPEDALDVAKDDELETGTDDVVHTHVHLDPFAGGYP
jgi:hypothetical protein